MMMIKSTTLAIAKITYLREYLMQQQQKQAMMMQLQQARTPVNFVHR